jgi:hypothetical protein
MATKLDHFIFKEKFLLYIKTLQVIKFLKQDGRPFKNQTLSQVFNGKT